MTKIALNKGAYLAGMFMSYTKNQSSLRNFHAQLACNTRGNFHHYSCPARKLHLHCCAPLLAVPHMAIVQQHRGAAPPQAPDRSSRNAAPCLPSLQPPAARLGH